MRQIQKLTFIAIMLVLASCGAKNNNPGLAEKKKQLEDLKKQQEKIAGDIKSLEETIAKLDTSAAKDEKPKLVTLAPLTPQTFTHYIDLQGKIESEFISNVTARGGGGQVKGVYVKKGDAVKKGQLLLKLDDAVLRQTVAASKQQLETLKTQLSYAKDIYTRQNNLWKQGIGTEVQLLGAKNNVDNLEKQLKAAEENVKVQQEQLNTTNVYADIDGVADNVNIRVGEIFNGANQITIVNTSSLKATAQIPENYLGRVNVGSKVKVSLPDINKTIDATVTVAGKLIDINTRSFYIEVKIPSDKDFHPNQLALVKILDYTAKNAMTVPVNAVQSDEKGKYVMVAVKKDNKLVAHKKAVTIGELYENLIEIKSGLDAGDQIVTEGFQSLYEGQALTTDTK